MEARLQKVLAHCGVASRRECETIIEQGRVEVNGKVVTRLGTKIDPDVDEIKVDGERVKREEKVYYLLNKPKGYLCTNSDERAQLRAVDLIKEHRRIYCVGRLDADSEGLLLLTNDGQVANIVCHPRYQVNKTYRLSVKGHVDPRSLEKIERGVWLAGGKTAPAEVKRVVRRGTRTLLTISLWEGRNRELRRMFAKVGLRVASLVRTAVGPLRADGLEVGAYRRLQPGELDFVFERLRDDWKPRDTDRPQPGRWRERVEQDNRGGRGRQTGGRGHGDRRDTGERRSHGGPRGRQGDRQGAGERRHGGRRDDARRHGGPRSGAPGERRRNDGGRRAGPGPRRPRPQRTPRL
ncbi:MAG: pseudouridine synthase [Planctomycetota bacterium]|nr:pseudouridine synthase [Planctomycetota bacterium]